MSAILAMLGTPLAQAIGWALVHLVWQGVVVAGILAALLALLQRHSAHVRYLVSCAAMLVLLGLAAATVVRAYDANGDALAPAAAQSTALTTADDAASQSSDAPALLARMRAALPKIVFFWILGVAALSIRLAGGWLRAMRLAKRNASPAAAEWQRVVARLSGALGLRRGVQMMHSAAVEVPTVLGWLRPVILLPMTLSGLSPEQIEMILAHELAHIRRHDFLVNLMQSFVETLLFYHPAVWWISARIRIEREHCCDDAAVRVGGNALQYARALTRLEELRGDASQLALAANGGSLIERIRRVAGIRGEGPGVPSRWLAGAALLIVVAVLLVAPSLPLLAHDQASTPPPPARPAPPPASAVASTPPAPAAPAPPAIAQSRIDVHADAGVDEEIDDVVDLPEPPEPPDPPEAPEAPRRRSRVVVVPRPAVAARPARAPRPVCPDLSDIHIPAMAIPKIQIEPMEIHIDHEAIEQAVRQGMDGAKMQAKIAASMKPGQKWLDDMRAAGLTMSEHEAMQLHVMGVTPRYVRGLRDAGLKKLTAHDVIRLHAMGITAGFVKELQRMQE